MAALRLATSVLLGTLFATFAYAEEDNERRIIEDIVVTAEKRESTVSDTSISITAFSGQMIEDFGLQGADELVNFIPSTTRDAFDIRVRGVGRNFRALGGDPGCCHLLQWRLFGRLWYRSLRKRPYTMYKRIEVLRGPQGTLYGRNSIGGALNYITNKPTYEFEGELTCGRRKFWLSKNITVCCLDRSLLINWHFELNGCHARS